MPTSTTTTTQAPATPPADDPETTTTTTTEDQETTTTTTTEQPETTTTTTKAPEGDQASPNAERQGEVEANKSADTKILGEEGETEEERLDAAKREALHNHDTEHKDDDPARAKREGRV